MLAEGIGAFTSQFKKGGMTRKNTKKKLSSKEIEFIEAYANGGSVEDNLIKKDAYKVGDRIKFIDRFRKEEKDGTLEEINEVGNYVVSYGSGITAGMRSVNPDEVIGAYPKAEPKKKRFGFFAKGGMTEEDKLLKELNKLQRELNSRRLQTYTLGDTSDTEKARQAEREVKAKRFYEILEILRKIDSKKYAKGGTTDPKPTAQDILKRLGYNIPQAEESQEEEPKIIRGWVDDEPYYFAKGGMSKDDSPKVYIADLTAYNNGQLIGKWFDLTDYSDGSELMQDIQKMLDEQTKKDKFGDVHEEYAVHDFENFPREFYSEYMGEADFDKLISLINDAEDSNLPFDVIAKAMADLGKDEVSEVVEAYFGSVPASMGNEWRDFAYEYVDMVGGISGVSNADYYFDYESFGSDERINMGGEAEEEMGYEDLSDTELGEQLVEEVGGIEALGESTIDMYFDYDKFGRELQYDFTSIRGEDGNYYFFNSNYKKGGKVKPKPEPEDDGEYQLSEEEKKIIRGYVDDEPYYFAEGGEITADEKKKSLKGYPKLKF
jgi:antirestriction protein